MSPVPFFILSCARSGSSLLSRMLNSHPLLAVPPESHLFNIFYPWLPYYDDLSDPQRQQRLVDDILSTPHIQHWVPKLEREQVLSSIGTGDFRGIVDAILTAWATSQNKSHWGEKTPQHIHYWPAIIECFPNAHFIHLVRDGRDVAMSHLRAPFGAKTVFSAARRWKAELSEVEKLKSAVKRENFCEVRYEDLLDNPEHELARVCNAVDESYVPEMLNFYEKPLTDYTESTNQENLQQPLLRSNKQKWRREMSSDQIHVFEAIAYDTLLRYGYEVVHDAQPELSPISVFFLRRVKSPLRKAPAMIKHRRGQEYELKKLQILVRLILEKRGIDFFWKAKRQ